MKRFNKRYIYYHLFADFFLGLFAVLAIGSEIIFDEGSGEFNLYALPILIAIFAAVYLLLTVYRLVFYRMSGYEMTECEIICKTGVLFRKRSIIEYSKIHAINKKQNIFQRLFGIAILTVDSGSANTAHKAEILLFESPTAVDEMLRELHVLREGGVKHTATAEAETLLDKDDPLYSFTSKRKMLYTLITIVTAVVGTVAILAIILVGMAIALALGAAGNLTAAGEAMLYGLLFFLGASLLVAVAAFIAGIIEAFVKYHDFKIEKIGTDIKISYGLLERHENSFSYEKIRAVKIRQGLIQRILGFASIKLEVIGYVEQNGNAAGDIGVLVPFCKMSEVNEILGRILPSYTPTERQTRSPRFFPYISWFTLILSVTTVLGLVVALIPMLILGTDAVVILAVGIAVLGVFALIFGIKLCSALLTYHTAGISIDGKKITVYDGGFVKQVTVMLRDSVSSVEEITTYHRARRGISSLVIHLRTNATTNEVKLPLQKREVAEMACELLKY